MAVTRPEPKQDANVVSSHGYVVDNSQDYTAPTASTETKSGEPGDAAAAAAATAAATAAAEAKAGEKGAADPAAADPAKAEPAKVAAEAGDPMAAVLQEIAGLKEALANPQQPQAGQEADPLAQIDQALGDLQEQARTGEISSEEFTMKVMPLFEQRVQINMERKSAQEKAVKSERDAQGAFIAQNPDFLSFAQSPEAAAMVNSNPVLDNVSAFYAAKHAQAEAQIQTLQQELQLLKTQQELAIKNAGQSQAKIVSGDAGTEAGAEKLFRGDGLPAQQGGLAALRRARAQQ